MDLIISDVPKMKVFESPNILIVKNSYSDQHYREAAFCRTSTRSKDSDSLPDYETLDAILHAYVEQGNSLQTIIENGYDPGVVRRIIRLVDLNEYKRKQAAPGLKTSPLAFGVGRRIPIVQKFHN